MKQAYTVENCEYGKKPEQLITLNMTRYLKIRPEQATKIEILFVPKFITKIKLTECNSF